MPIHTPQTAQLEAERAKGLAPHRQQYALFTAPLMKIIGGFADKWTTRMTIFLRTPHSNCDTLRA